MMLLHGNHIISKYRINDVQFNGQFPVQYLHYMLLLGYCRFTLLGVLESEGW